MTKAYYHTDQLGTVRGISQTFSSPTWQESLAFTAFGERITGTQNSFMTRVGYVGAYGYQSTPVFETIPDSDIGVLHVGHRYYDPPSGRFLQRDPIGIRGGFNVYSYIRANPTLSIDPSGLDGGSGMQPPMFDDKIDKLLDRWGRAIEDRKADLWAELVGLAGMRVPKVIPNPGSPASTTSIWTKVPGIPPWLGRTLGRVFLPATLTCGAIDVYAVVAGLWDAL